MGSLRELGFFSQHPATLLGKPGISPNDPHQQTIPISVGVSTAKKTNCSQNNSERVTLLLYRGLNHSPW